MIKIIICINGCFDVKRWCSGSGAEGVKHTTRPERISNGIIHSLVNAFRNSSPSGSQIRHHRFMSGVCCVSRFNNGAR